MKNRVRVFILVVLLVAIASCHGALILDTFAASGSGSSGSAGSSGCDTTPTVMIRQATDCGHPELGGVAWFIFKTKDSYYPGYQLYKFNTSTGQSFYGPRYCKDPLSDQNKSKCASVPLLLKAGGYDKKLATTCPSDKYDYYAAYVGIGWNGTWNKSTKEYPYAPTYWGPFGWNRKVSTSHGDKTPTKNTVGQHSFDETFKAWQEGKNIDGWKISNDAAKKFCKLDTSGSGPCGSVTTKTLPDGVGYICVKFDASEDDVTLDVDAIDEEGNILEKGIDTDSGTTTNDGSIKLSVKVDNDYLESGGKTYSFLKYWRDTPTGSAVNNNKYTYEKTISEDTTVYAVYAPNEFEGRSEVGDKSIGYTNTSGVADTYFIDNCSAENGCDVKFKHYLKRTQGTLKTNYVVSRMSNLTDSSSARSISTGVLKQGESSSSNGEEVYSETLKLYPGMKVCESLEFNSYPDDNLADDTIESNVEDLEDTDEMIDGEDSTTTIVVCASALGNAQPGDPTPGTGEDPDTLTGDRSFVNIRVRNSSVAKYNNYVQEVYAKPGDTVMYRASYNPVLQYTYYLKPEQMQINGGAVINGGGSRLGDLFDANRGSLQPWNNAFTILSSKDNFNNTGLVADYIYNKGDMGLQRPNANSKVIADGDVGKSVDERAITSVNAATQTTPSQVTFTNNNGENLGNVDTSSRYRTAYARVPYNFKITTGITTPETTPVYAGEDFKIDFSVNVDPKINNVTTNNNGEYVTRADEVRKELVVYVPRSNTNLNGGEMAGGRETDVCSRYFGLSNNEVDCGYSTVSTDDLSKGAHAESKKFYAQDLAAGSKICVAVAVFPASSGSDTNWNDKNYSGSWRISDSKCYTIAKRPNLQVWGGNVYARGGILTAIANKRHLSGESYSVSGDNNYYGNHLFGSWGELGVISNGGVSGFASGASTGYAGGNTNLKSGANWPLSNPFAPGGFTGAELGFARRSRMTFSNSPAVGVIGTDINTGEVGNNKQKIIDILASYDESINEYYTYLDGGQKIDGNDISVANLTKVIRVNGDTTIVGNLTYSGTYTALSDVPKLVIYASNINISCSVTRIDALLVADGTVNTCTDDNGNGDLDINGRARANQLVINGAIIANKLVPGRTYGAATGSNSITPAEIINFDPTLYRFGGSTDNSADDSVGELETTYIHELAPRR